MNAIFSPVLLVGFLARSADDAGSSVPVLRFVSVSSSSPVGVHQLEYFIVALLPSSGAICVLQSLCGGGQCLWMVAGSAKYKQRQSLFVLVSLGMNQKYLIFRF